MTRKRGKRTDEMSARSNSLNFVCEIVDLKFWSAQRSKLGSMGQNYWWRQPHTFIYTHHYFSHFNSFLSLLDFGVTNPILICIKHVWCNELNSNDKILLFMVRDFKFETSDILISSSNYWNTSKNNNSIQFKSFELSNQ